VKQSIHLIDAGALKELLARETDAVLIDTREELEFSQGHIENAISNQWFQWCAKAPPTAKSTLFEPGYWGNLDVDSIENIEKSLGDLGITNSGTVILYSSGIASKGREGRLAWMLLYFGIEKVYILDGGYNAWLNSRGEVSTNIVEPKRAKFEVALQHERRIDIDGVKKLLDGDRGCEPLLVDTRSPMEFEGRLYDYQPRMGHIPRSVNIWFDRYFASDGRFIGNEQFLSLLESEGAIDIKATYCEVGVRAATFALLFELATGAILPVYDGSLMEWSHNPELTVISGCHDDRDGET
jgi:thiosulfate/3-mercaptopyruvate sulfurtransferase